MTGDSGAIVYAITPLDADGVDEGKQATIEGLVVQRYTYPNAVGGATQSLVIVGRFAGKGRRVLTGGR